MFGFDFFKRNNSKALASPEEQPGEAGGTTLRFGDRLVEMGRIDAPTLDLALATQRITGEKIGTILVREGVIKYAEMIELLATYAPEHLTTETAQSIRPSAEELRNCGVLIAAETEDELFAATIGSEACARDMLERHYQEKRVRFIALAPHLLDEFLTKVTFLAGDRTGGERDGGGVIWERILRRAVSMGASDIHLEARDGGTFMCRFRVDGCFLPPEIGGMSDYVRLVAAIKDRARMDVSETRRTQDGGYDELRNGRRVNYRVATLPTVGHYEKLVIRLLDQEASSPDIDSLGITRIDEWRSGTDRRNGVAFIVGETGSGKTTTLNATLRSADRLGKSIYTIEDPVEYRIPSIAQINVNTSVGLTFGAGVKACMRADPDIIVIGEIRDLETAHIALAAAETGHLVIATIHANDIRGTVARLREIGLKPNDFRHLLRVILVQTLVRNLCPKCGGAGCSDCGESGYKGRTVVSECKEFRTEDDVARLLETNDRWWSTIVEDAVGKMDAGVTDEREIRRVFGSEAEDALDRRTRKEAA